MGCKDVEMPKKPDPDPQVAFLVMSLTNLVAETVEAKCSTLTARERKTLERRILKAVEMFVARAKGTSRRNDAKTQATS
jgi:hypothetical protein